jgi:hypothetical protein
MRALFFLPFLLACTNHLAKDAAREEVSRGWPRCYALRTGAWTPAAGQQLHVTHSPPPIVHLDTQRVGRDVDPVARRVTPHIPALSRGGFLAPSWTPVPPDSLQLMWSSGYEGVVVRLRERGDSVDGAARTFTDYGAQALAPVHGWRVACPADTSRG